MDGPIIGEIIGYLQKGGILLIPIFAVTFIGLCLVFERHLYFRKFKNQTTVINEALDIFTPKELSKMYGLFKQHPDEVTHILKKGLSFFHQGNAVLENRLKQAIYEQMAEVQKHLSSIHVIAAILPMLGLLGTVTGMISVFNVLALGAMADPTGMSGGISEALITTQAGIACSVCLLYCHNVLLNKVDRISIELKRASASILNLARLKERRKQVL